MNRRTNKIYSNITIQAPDGEPLSKVPAKRARWYCNRGLAIPQGEKTIRLTFEPQARTALPDWYLEEHHNRCVVCGEEELGVLERHHLVPKCFRRHLPKELKDKRCFDLLILCEICHSDYEIHANHLKTTLMEEAGIVWPAQTDEYKTKQAAVKAMKTLISAVQPGAYPISEEAKVASLERIRGILDENATMEDADRLNDALAKELRGVWPRILAAQESIEGFIVRWRKHFLEFAQPKFLSPEWLKDVEVVK